MIKILSAEEMSRCDKYTIEHMGISSPALMLRAAEAAAAELSAGGFDMRRVLIVCGSGNNGGDGIIMARLLKNRGYNVSLYFTANGHPSSEQLREELLKTKNSGVKFISDISEFSDYTVIADAVFGTGLSRKISGTYADVIRAMEEAPAPVFSIDIPSGISSDTGAVMGCAVHAAKTVTFAFLKRGLALYPGAEYAGEIKICDIGVGTDALTSCPCTAYERGDIPSILPVRTPDSNKGTYGRVLVIAGSRGMSGAAYLSALAAYRTGAGLVRIFTDEANLTILQTLLPEAIVTAYSGAGDAAEKLAEAIEWADSAVIGPGLGKSELSRLIVSETMSKIKVPAVIDADALNIISEKESFVYPETPVIITPHPGEMSRLTGTDTAEIKSDLPGNSGRYASEKGVVCLLKDARSVICGDGRMMINLSGCSAMAKGGSGDVLTGIISALAAQGVGAFEAASAAAYIHGLAGEAAAKKHGIRSSLAHEIAECISDII